MIHKNGQITLKITTLDKHTLKNYKVHGRAMDKRKHKYQNLYIHLWLWKAVNIPSPLKACSLSKSTNCTNFYCKIKFWQVLIFSATKFIWFIIVVTDVIHKTFKDKVVTFIVSNPSPLWPLLWGGRAKCAAVPQ